MHPRELTAEEMAAFCQEITKDLALDYFYTFDNVPLRHVYGDALIGGEDSDLESRNRAITESIWLESYHELLESNVIFGFTYRGGVLQMPLQVHRLGAAGFRPPDDAGKRPYRSFDALKSDLAVWLSGEGKQIADRLRAKPPQASWQTVLKVPDRTARIVSITPIQNQVILELITTWTDGAALRETAWVVVLLYDHDGTVLQDRSYIEMANWPSGRRYMAAIERAPDELPNTAGALDRYYDYHRSLREPRSLSGSEATNLAIAEGAWLDHQNGAIEADPRLPERFRLQLPMQKRSCSHDVASEVDGFARAANDASMRLVLTYARGNQVVTEGIVDWTDDGGAGRESAFVSFLLFDDDRRVIRERRYLSLDNWPGADGLTALLGL